MKKIINGKMYDTETAKEIGTWDNRKPVNDFNFVEETLYKKKTGEYFLYGEGGGLTRYAEQCYGGGWSSGKAITPLSYDDALEWTEKHLDADEYIAEFGEPEEGEAQISVRVPAAAKRLLDVECSKREVTQAQIIGELLETLA